MAISSKVQYLVLVIILSICESHSSNVNTFIVHIDKTLMPSPFTSPDAWYSSMISTLKADASNKPNILYRYNHVIHGFSAVLSPYELQKLKTSPGFLAAYEDRAVELYTTHSIEFLSLNNSTGLWPASNFGRNVIIGVIDTGIWPESLSFHDHGMPQVPKRWKGMCVVGEDFNSSLCNKKLIGAKVFHKGAKANNSGANMKPNSPRDLFGHGTHTSSIAAGNFVENAEFFGYGKGKAKGVAPRAWLAIYNIVSQHIGIHSTDLIAGIDEAVGDGVDVLSLSLGLGEIPFYENPLAIATFAAMEKGVFVAIAAGNSGPEQGTLGNAIPWTLTVGAASIDRSFTGTLTLGNGETIVGWTLFPASAVLENIPLYYNKSMASCDNLDSLSRISYAIIVCISNPQSLSDQIYAVSRANVAGAIFLCHGSLLFEELEFQWPGVVISEEYASLVINYAETRSQPSATIIFQQTRVGTKPAPVVGRYSSRGPSRYNPELLKPDLLAPGTLILAAYVPRKYAARISSITLSSDFNLLTGTSMACPHAAGVSALLKSAHPTWSPAIISSALLTTANPLDNTGNPIRDNGRELDVASPLDIGAGFIDPNRALDPGLVYDISPVDYVNFLCSMNYTKAQLLTITRSHKYNCSSPSSDLNYPNFMIVRRSNNMTSSFVQRFKRTVTNVGEGPAKYWANISSPQGCEATVSPNILAFEAKNGKRTYSLTVHSCKGHMKVVTHGWLIWTEVNGTHSVRSPIVVI